ncbi:hypothetical protein EJ05DRAFT_288262 [Pseudovirgaria hyperparasitica]|uniref:Uncharacterized protein n=1 Tax=Pseudovirgaria hyperparasitica TaxID=470096 RepID=A0A6A6WFZ9_9PEZI|nr:uncharacterized protein EJ05DRAFT_288262 [Pseudovirgaria hyperparasitica]KAF2760537.1 hypothetical protein EJ05DRAFT_288262 [Pseudovirgaria hyperparasitica]
MYEISSESRLPVAPPLPIHSRGAVRSIAVASSVACSSVKFELDNTRDPLNAAKSSTSNHRHWRGVTTLGLKTSINLVRSPMFDKGFSRGISVLFGHRSSPLIVIGRPHPTLRFCSIQHVTGAFQAQCYRILSFCKVGLLVQSIASSVLLECSSCPI